MPAWHDIKKWQSLRDGSACPICLQGQPNDVLVEFATSWITGGSLAPLPGYVCVVSKRHVVEPFELPKAERAAFWEEAMKAAEAVKGLFHPVKINYQIHGNTIPHLHLHIFPRFQDDPYAKAPTSPWQNSLFTRTPQELERIRQALENK